MTDNAVWQDEDAGSLRERLVAGARDTFIRAWRGENSGALIIVMAVVIGVFAVALRDTNYLTTTNFFNVFRQTAAITCMAVPMVFVIATGEMDLSIAAVVPVAAFISALLLPGYGVLIGAVAALGFGVLVGLFNGIIMTRFRIPSFVVTLGMLSILNGMALRITNVQSVPITDLTFKQVFGGVDVGPVPTLLVWTLGVVILGYVVLARTPVGRAVLATGANPNAARFSGIRTNRVKIGAMVASSVGGALAGLLYSAQFAAATYTLGGSDMLSVFAAVIIGGTALTGGKGSVFGALIGSLLIGILNNGLVIIGLSNPELLMARGAIIIGAVLFSARTVGQSRTSRARRHAATSKAETPPEAGEHR